MLPRIIHSIIKFIYQLDPQQCLKLNLNAVLVKFVVTYGQLKYTETDKITLYSITNIIYHLLSNLRLLQSYKEEKISILAPC